MSLEIRKEGSDVFKVVAGGLKTYKITVSGGLVGNPECTMTCRGFTFEDTFWLIEKDFRDGMNAFIKGTNGDRWIRRYGYITSSLMKRMGSHRKNISKDANYNKKVIEQGIPEANQFPKGSFICIDFKSADEIADIYDGLRLHYEEVAITIVNPVVPKATKEKKNGISHKQMGEFYAYVCEELKDEELIELFMGYLELRKENRWTLNHLVVERLVHRLRECSGGSVTVACKIVTHAILRGWKLFYPVKGV